MVTRWKSCSFMVHISHISGEKKTSSWRILKHWNVVLTMFHNDHISQGLCNIFICYQILGRKSWKRKKKIMRHLWDIFKWPLPYYWRITIHWNLVLTILLCCHYWKFLELHFNVSSYRCKKIQNSIKMSCTQDLRV